MLVENVRHKDVVDRSTVATVAPMTTPCHPRRPLPEKHFATCTMLLHDMRNIAQPMMRVVSDCEVHDDPAIRKLGERVERSMARILQICSAEIDPLRQRTRNEPVEEVCSNVVTILSAQCGPKTSIRLDECPDMDVPRDATALFRLLLNLVSNAVNSVNKSGGGIVDISLCRDLSDLIIDIVDQGKGIAPPPGTAEISDGSGLGTVIVGQMVDRLNATLDIHSSGSAGTHLRLRIPFDHREG